MCNVYLVLIMECRSSLIFIILSQHELLFINIDWILNDLAKVQFHVRFKTQIQGFIDEILKILHFIKVYLTATKFFFLLLYNGRPLQSLIVKGEFFDRVRRSKKLLCLTFLVQFLLFLQKIQKTWELLEPKRLLLNLIEATLFAFKAHIFVDEGGASDE